MGTPGYSYSSGNFGLYANLSAVGMVLKGVSDWDGEEIYITFPPLGIPALTQPPDEHSDVRLTYFGT